MTPDTITLSRAEYEALIDARDHAQAMRDVAGGAELVDEADMDAYLASPLAYWRKRRGLTQAGLAAQAGTVQSHLAQIESGARGGSVAIYVRLARILGTSIEDLLPAGADQAG